MPISINLHISKVTLRQARPRERSSCEDEAMLTTIMYHLHPR